MSSSIYTQIKREYEKTRDKNRTLLRGRQNEIYALIPRVKEIDDLFIQIYVKIQRLILSAGGGKDAHLKEFEKETSALAKEKARLLAEAGFKKTYLDEVFSCRHCKDTGYLQDGARCACHNRKLIEKRYNQSNLSERLKRENFDNFDIRYYSEERDKNRGISPRKNAERIYENCVKFVEKFDVNYQNLLFCGRAGLGKTFLCSAIAKELLDKGKTVIYLTAAKLCKFFEDKRFRSEEYPDGDGFENLIYSADLLIIDDLGAEIPTQVTLSALFEVINTRIIEKKHTIISTNSDIFADEQARADFENTYSDRITSRLLGEFNNLRLFGQDIRNNKKYAAQSIS